MDTSSVVLVTELIKQLRLSMEVLAVNSSDKESLTPSLGTVNIEDLEKQMKQFKEELIRNNMNNSVNNKPNRKSSYSSPTNGSINENHALFEERDALARENKNLKEEAARLRNENLVIKKKLEEEALSRQRLQRELSEFGKLLESKRSIISPEKRSNGIIKEIEAPSSGQKLNNCSAETQKQSVETFFYEKVKACKSLSVDDKKEREELHYRNIELERQLCDAKKTVRAHEKRLVVYSQIHNNPVNLSYNLKPQSYPKASSCPSSPSNNSSNQQSLFRKHYDRNCNDQYLNVKWDPRTARKFNSCDSISSDYSIPTNCCSQGLDWRYDMDVLARKPRSSSEHSKFCEYKSS